MYVWKINDFNRSWKKKKKIDLNQFKHFFDLNWLKKMHTKINNLNLFMAEKKMI